MAASSNSTKGDSGTSGGFSSVRGAYEAMGAPAFYKAHGAEYTNPHAPLLFSCMRNALQRWVVPWPMPAVHVLDLACGGGEATLAFEAAMKEVITPPRAVQTEACDPYTHACYEARTGRRCHRWSFGDIANGQLDSRCSAAGPFDVVLASFCLHLLEGKEDRALDNAASPRSDLKQPGPTSAPLDATLRALARVGPSWSSSLGSGEATSRAPSRARIPPLLAPSTAPSPRSSAPSSAPGLSSAPPHTAPYGARACSLVGGGER